MGTDEGQRLYVWEGIPPSDEFVCLGMLTTVTDKAPSLDSLRCVPRRWTTPSRDTPEVRGRGQGGDVGTPTLTLALTLRHTWQQHPSGAFGTLGRRLACVLGDSVSIEGIRSGSPYLDADGKAAGGLAVWFIWAVRALQY